MFFLYIETLVESSHTFCMVLIAYQELTLIDIFTLKAIEKSSLNSEQSPLDCSLEGEEDVLEDDDSDMSNFEDEVIYFNWLYESTGTYKYSITTFIALSSI